MQPTRGATGAFARACALALAAISVAPAARSQQSDVATAKGPAPATAGSPAPGAALSRYYDPQQGTSSDDLVRRALRSNGELAAARLEVARARARVRQAGLRPNPTLDFEQTTGRLTGSPGERETSVGVSLPVELGGKRRRRMEL